MLAWKDAIGLAAAASTLFCYAPYFHGLRRGHTKPHVFSWLIWTAAQGTVFAVQHVSGGGAGSWPAAISAVFCGIISLIALRQGETSISISDWIALVGAVIALLLWPLTRDPLWSIVGMTIIDTLGFYPTFRKSWHKPYGEAIMTYALAALGALLSLPALGSYSLVNMLFPAYIALLNAAFIAMTMWRRGETAQHLFAQDRR